MTDIVTLDDALQAVAGASFYDDKRIVPAIHADSGEPVGYVVEDDHAHASDDWTWTYADGLHDRDSVSETSRLHDVCESYVDAGHIRYNMSGAVEQLEQGNAVTFAYAAVHDGDVHYDEDGNPRDSDGELLGDDLAGWILVAIWDD